MLQRLIAWCVPESALELRVVDAERADIAGALAPYDAEPALGDAPPGLRIVGNA
jgi:hypothetical protein